MIEGGQIELTIQTLILFFWGGGIWDRITT